MKCWKISIRHVILKRISINISKYFFLILFLGFLGSITLFNHAHVVNGITIVHSHPFKSDSNGKPIHSHNNKEFITIHLLSVISVITIILYISIESIKPLLYRIVPGIRQAVVNNLQCLSYSLRAPPSDMLN